MAGIEFSGSFVARGCRFEVTVQGGFTFDSQYSVQHLTHLDTCFACARKSYSACLPQPAEVKLCRCAKSRRCHQKTRRPSSAMTVTCFFHSGFTPTWIISHDYNEVTVEKQLCRKQRPPLSASIRPKCPERWVLKVLPTMSPKPFHKLRAHNSKS